MAERTNPFAAKKAGAAEPKSRQKATVSKETTQKNTDLMTDSEAWPRNASGKPMAKISMVASELIPTGQFANIMVGPAQITMFVDPDSSEGLSEDERSNVANALNQIAEIVEVDVVAVQRALILQSMQEQLKEEQKA